VSEPLVIDLSESEHLQGFLDEAQEHMDAIEAGLLAVEANPADTHQLNELFRPFHTIKGIAGFLNLRDINRLTHEIETILDLGRKNELRITAGIVDLIFKAVDSLKAQLDAIRTYMAAPTGGPCPQPNIAEMMGKLRKAAAGECQSDEPETCGTPQRAVSASGDDAQPGASAAPGPAGKAAQTDHSIRVDTSKLDTLVDAVGELVIAQSMVGLSSTVLADDKLARVVSQVTKIVRDVQETAMAMRMVPIGQTFQKMRRLVRDVARKAGKHVELAIEGEETELDKNVIQQISDPLVHMVRNAVDHGVEPPDVRKAVGKPETGTVTLNAYHQGDSIVIEIRDDGRGLDRDKLIAKALERGIISPDDQLSDQQAFALIFAPGFSTAEVVTDISGRGVGMDVVRRNVEQLRGKIEIHSEKGRGSTFLIKLPLTLAIIDGMLVRVGTERLIIPTILIEQSLRPERRQITSVQKRGQMVQIRGELCPLIQLGALFDYGPPVDPCENQIVVVLCESQKIALVVEELIGQQQVVIKSLGERFKIVRGVSGAAILGDGKVGLILEPSGILTLHKERGSPTFGPPPAEELNAPPPGERNAMDTPALEAACAAG
jgi:two-component system chemotaxis sensor kinase CheA